MDRKHYHDPPLTPAQKSGDAPIVENAVPCGLCQSGADRFKYMFICRSNPGHIGDLNVGIFSDLTFPHDQANP
jgi:hypothetical protein